MKRLNEEKSAFFICNFICMFFPFLPRLIICTYQFNGWIVFSILLVAHLVHLSEVFLLPLSHGFSLQRSRLASGAEIKLLGHHHHDLQFISVYVHVERATASDRDDRSENCMDIPVLYCMSPFKA